MNNELQLLSPPSATILRKVSDLNIDLKKFRELLNLTVDEFGKLVHDQLKISDELAYQFSKILGGSEIFWSNRYRDYFDESAQSNTHIYSKYKKTLDSLCLSRNIEIDKLLVDFQYSTLEYLISDYFESPVILYSKNQRFEPSPVKLANWLRECEKEGEQLIYEGYVRKFSSETLHDEILNIISYTKVNKIQNILDKIQEICYRCGVILLFKSSESGYGISGLAKRLLNNYRLVVITDRYKNNAAFWFTLLHELAHCILHSLRSPLIHYSDEEFLLASLKSNNIYEEKEANCYVETLLFPNGVKIDIQKCNSYRDILSLAVKFDISASLIVAQIHREKIAPYSWYRKVYRNVEF
jgi:plasmid maintenance system antidote protein VapI/Zn-dependent peptidase ImmA (M78 family)